MSNNQLAGFPAYGARVDSIVVYNPAQTTLETPVELPTSEPATAQVQITTAVGQLPTFSPYLVPWDSAVFNSEYYTSVLIAIVKNNTASTRTIYRRYKIDNTPTWAIAAPFTALAGRYVGISVPGLSTWSIGDAQELMLYANNAGCNLLAYGLLIIPNAVGKGLPAAGVAELVVETDTASLFAGWGTTTASALYATLQSANGSTIISGGTVKTERLALAPDSSSGILTTIMTAQSAQATSLTYHSPVYPTRIAYTPIL
jgi:hypothetical protein